MIECWWYERELGSTIELTPHALKRKAERGFTDSDIIKILKYGRQRSGTNQIWYDDLFVAAERIDKCIRIITVCRRGEDLLAA